MSVFIGFLLFICLLFIYLCVKLFDCCLFVWFGHPKGACSDLDTREALGLIWTLERRLVWFGHSRGAWSDLVTREALGLIRTLERCLVWFGHSRAAWSDLNHSRDVRGCGILFVMRLSGFVYSRDVSLIWITREMSSHSRDVKKPWPGYPRAKMQRFLPKTP